MNTGRLALEMEQKLTQVGPDDTVDPELFAASATGTVVIATVPLGIDLRFCRGVRLGTSRAADGKFTLEIESYEPSAYRLGQVNRNDGLIGMPTRSVQIPYREIVQHWHKIPTFRRRKAEKVFVKRDGNFLLTFNVQVE